MSIFKVQRVHSNIIARFESREGRDVLSGESNRDLAIHISERQATLLASFFPAFQGPGRVAEWWDVFMGT